MIRTFLAPSLARLLAAATLFALGTAGGCSEEAPPASRYRALVSEGCLLSSDCNEPLVCAFRRCHQQCRADRDCAQGQYCTATDVPPLAVCLLPEEQRCKLNSECPEPLLCSAAAECRDACRTARDCLEGQTCNAGTCASGGGAGGAGAGPGATPKATEGGTCSYTSDCVEPLVCRAGTCLVECRQTVDCPALTTCEGGRCRARSPDGPVYCVPGAILVCDCPSGERGSQICVDDGSRVGPCDACP